MQLNSLKSTWNGSVSRKPKVYLIEVNPRSKAISETIYLLIEREEFIQYSDSQEIDSASIRISYQWALPVGSRHAFGYAPFVASYSRSRNRVSLTSEIVGRGAVFLDPDDLRGRGIGSYLMNEIVGWAKQWPAAHVNEIELLEDNDEVNRLRRNRFYQQFGIEFEWKGAPENSEAIAKPMLTDALSQIESWKTYIREHDIDNFIGDMIYERKDAKLIIKNLSENLKEHHDNLSQRPIVTMMSWVWSKYWPRILSSVFVLLIIVAVLKSILDF